MANLFLDRLLSGLAPRETKASGAAPAIVGSSVGVPVWMPRRYDQFAEEGYFKNAIAFHCISMIATASAGIPIMLVDKKSKKEIEDHPLLTLLKNPAPNVTGSELIERALTFLLIAGNSYLEKVGPSRLTAPPKELYALRPDRIHVIAGKDAIPAAYEYEANGRKVRFDVDPITGQGSILQLKRMNPLDDWYGMSSMEPAAYAIDRHNEAGAHNMALLQNGAVPSGALVFKPVVVDGSQQNAPTEIIDKAEKKLNAKYSGSLNAGKPMVLGGNVSWEQFGFSMEQLQLTESKADAARDICTAYGVPHILVVPGQSTYNNNAEAKLALYEETVVPGFQWFLDHLNIWLTPLFGDNLEITADLDSVTALSPRREENRKSQLELFKEKLITRSEAREAMDYDDLPDMAPFDPEGHDVQAISSLILGNKLSMETGLRQLQIWGMIPKDVDVTEEVDKITEEGGNVDGMTSDTIDPITGLPTAPAAPPAPGLPKPPARLPSPKPPVAAKPGA